MEGEKEGMWEIRMVRENKEGSGKEKNSGRMILWDLYMHEKVKVGMYYGSEGKVGRYQGS